MGAQDAALTGSPTDAANFANQIADAAEAAALGGSDATDIVQEVEIVAGLPPFGAPPQSPPPPVSPPPQSPPPQSLSPHGPPTPPPPLSPRLGDVVSSNPEPAPPPAQSLFVPAAPPPPGLPPDLSQAYGKLLTDLKSGADSSTIFNDAQQLAEVAGKHGNVGIEQVAINIGNSTKDGTYDQNGSLQALTADGNGVNYIPQQITSFTDPLVNAYNQLQIDVASGADPQKIKADAQLVSQLAPPEGDGGLASAASNIINSLSDGSYDQTKSLAALMSNGPYVGLPASDVDGPYRKLLTDIQSGADKNTIQNDAQQLAVAAGKAGDPGLEQAALNIGNSLNDGSYDQKASLQALTDYAPGTAKASGSVGPTGNPLNDAYTQLERDVANGADPQTIKADAQHVSELAKNQGVGGLASAADNIGNSISDGSYDQTKSLTALMENTPKASPPSPPPPPSSAPPTSSSSEATAYQKLVSDIASGADKGTIQSDVQQLAGAAIRNGDFGLAQVALDIGTSVKNGSYDPNTAAQALGPVAPGTSAAQLPPITANVSA